MHRLAALMAVTSCSSGKPPPPAVAPVTNAVTVAPVPATHDAWVEAVTAKDRARVEAMIALPVWIYYDDGVTSVPRKECRRWRRNFQQATTPAERSEIAACIVATAFHMPFADPIQPTGIVTLAQVEPFIPEPARARVAQLGRDHVLIHGHSLASSDFDFTLAVPRAGAAADLVIVTSEPGE